MKIDYEQILLLGDFEQYMGQPIKCIEAKKDATEIEMLSGGKFKMVVKEFVKDETPVWMSIDEKYAVIG